MYKEWYVCGGVCLTDGRLMPLRSAVMAAGPTQFL